MNSLEPVALWLALVMGAWAAVTATVPFGSDRRLLRSGARGLHAAAALSLVALVTFLVARRAAVLATSDVAAWTIALRTALAAPDGLALLVATAAAIGTAVALHAARLHPSHDQRIAHRRAGLLVATVALATIVARAFWGDAVEGAIPVELFSASGVAFRALLALGVGLLAAPAVLAPLGRPALQLRLCAAALTVQLLALLLGAWSRYAAATPPTELDAGGSLLEVRWTTAYLLLLVPPLVTGAAVATLHARTHAGGRRARSAVVLLLAAAAMIVSVIAPPIRDWVVGRDVAPGMPISPLQAWEASFGAAVAVVLTGWLARRAVRPASLHVRMTRIAAAGVAATAGLAILALSTDARELTLPPGGTATFGAMGQEWRFASQGASQEEAPTYDGALVAFEVRSSGGTRLATAGERIYRDGHGHPAGRVAVPAVMRALGGDVRFTVRALRGDEVLVRAQFHPFATVAWMVAALTVLAFAMVALLRRREGE